MPTLDLVAEIARRIAVAGEDRHAVAELVGVDEIDRALVIGHAHHAQHRPENLLLVDRHLRRDAVEQRAADPVALRVAGHRPAAPIDH